MANTTAQPPKKSSGTTTKTNNQNEKIAALEAQIKMLTDLLMAQQTAQATAPAAQPAAGKRFEEVTVVHMVERAEGLRTHIELSHMTIDFRKFGEERTLSLMDFEELVGKYRSFFERGILAVGDGEVDVAKRYSIKVTTEYPINRDLIKKLGTMSMTELEELYTKLGEGHRKFILEQWRRKCLQNNPNFKDIRKLEVLNRLSDGAMESVILDMRTQSEKEKIDDAKAARK